MLKTIFTLTSFIVGLSLTLVGLELSEVSLPHRSENIIVLFLILLMINVTFSIHLDLSSPFNFVFFLAYTTILYILLTHPGESFNYICSCLVTLSPILIAILQKSKKDNPESYQYLFQDGASPLMEEVSILHNKIMLILIIIIFMVLWLIIKSLVSKAYYKLLTDGALVEIIWTTIPAIILFFIAFPSLKLLYIMDEVMDPALTIKVVGHQWYWSYEYSDYFLETWEFDSYLISIADLKTGGFRLLEVDNILTVPLNTNVRALITSADVLHSFTVPALSVKTDAIPGRLNQINFIIKRVGVYYGQCSEICGANHSFMPILVQAISIDKYLALIPSQ